MAQIRYISVPEAIAINVAVIQKYSAGEQIGVKSTGMLESAVLCPQSSAFGYDAYVTIFDKAAALFESLGQNHPFQNGNKRTAFTALVIFLKYNGYHFKMDFKAAENFTVDMANHQFTFKELSETIKLHAIIF
jgi:death-on-curing protein